MENISADNENDILHMCSMISNHNSVGYLHMFDKDKIAKAVFDMVNVTVVMGYHPIIFNMALIYYMYIYDVCLIVY